MDSVLITVIVCLMGIMIILQIAHTRDLSRELAWWARECSREYHKGYSDAINEIEAYQEQMMIKDLDLEEE